MNVVKELLWLKGLNVKILKVSEQVVNKEKIKVITIIGAIKKVKCTICKKYTYNIHNKLKPMGIKCLKMAEQKNGNSVNKKKIYLS